jgi:hypothetical protein
MILDRLYRVWRWWVRGVGKGEYRHICGRCGKTGQDHWAWGGCWRFQLQEQRFYVWCPGCKADLAGQEEACVDDVCGPDGLVWYCCTLCREHSVWAFHEGPFARLVQRSPYLEVVE